MGHRILKPKDYAKRGGFIVVGSAISSGAKSVQPDLRCISNYVDVSDENKESSAVLQWLKTCLKESLGQCPCLEDHAQAPLQLKGVIPITTCQQMARRWRF
jgi:hypothetical protein